MKNKPKSGSGNLAWKIAGRRTRIGQPGRKLCKYCGRLAVKDANVCYGHGGRLIKARQRQYAPRLRYTNWTMSKRQELDEPKITTAEIECWPIGGDV